MGRWAGSADADIRSGTGRRRESSKETRRFTYSGEGWGRRRRPASGDERWQCNTRARPATLAEVSRVEAHDENGPVSALNELEMVRGTFFANTWQTERIVMIALDSGGVTGWLDLRGLLSASERAQTDVLTASVRRGRKPCS